MKRHRIELRQGDKTPYEFEGLYLRRSAIIGRVQRGELLPEEAEREALRQGCGQLKVEPDPSAFDPMAEARWTLPMTLAWIRWREPAQVTEWDNRYRLERLAWAPLSLVVRESDDSAAVIDSYTLAQEQAASCELIRETLMRDAPPTPTSARSRPKAAAEKELWSSLADGHVKAQASLGSHGRIEPMLIPAHEWSRLTARTAAGSCKVSDSADYLAFEDHPSVPVYVHVDLSREEVVKRWPETTAEDSAAAAETAPNMPRNGLSSSEWARRPETQAVALQRLKNGGERAPTETMIEKEMSLMLQEQDVSFEQDSIRRARDRKRSK